MKRNLIPYLKDILDNLELAEGFTRACLMMNLA
jgi:hypothetical protein